MRGELGPDLLFALIQCGKDSLRSGCLVLLLVVKVIGLDVPFLSTLPDAGDRPVAPARRNAFSSKTHLVSWVRRTTSYLGVFSYSFHRLCTNPVPAAPAPSAQISSASPVLHFHCRCPNTPLTFFIKACYRPVPNPQNLTCCPSVSWCPHVATPGTVLSLSLLGLRHTGFLAEPQICRAVSSSRLSPVGGGAPPPGPPS